ncbi:MAG: alpha/beta fold hydrolase [Acidobacteriota bacterium]
MSSKPLASFHREFQTTSRPIWLEALAGMDWLALHASPVYYGLGVPRGDRSAVVVVPGFLGTDLYLTEMYYWLRRIGYNPYFSGIGWNADCLNTLVRRLLKTVEKAYDETGKRVHLIGHSLGGVLSRSAAEKRPNHIASVITLGSPFRGVRSHPIVLETSKIVRERILAARKGKPGYPDTYPECYTGFCTCDAVMSLQSFSETVQETAIYTKTDGIVDWKVCITENPESDFEVLATHVGLAFNPTVYSIMAKRLSKAIKKH